jgi:hypothetical protein
MAHQSTTNGRKDRAESTPVLISNHSTEQGHNIRPERVDCLGQ